MTTPYTPPEDAFDQWLDALVDEEDRQLDDDRAEVAAFLQRHFALSPADGSVSEPKEHAASPSRAGKRPASATGSPKRAGIVPMGGAGAGWHVASLLSAAVLVLIAIGMIGALLRMGDDDHHGGVSATASMLPFAPSPALASPTPAATCATDDTLLLNTTEPVGAGAFADLPFPVAWLADGTLTVARAGEVLGEFEIGDFPILQPTPVPNVIHAASALAPDGSGRGAFVNIATGETIEIGEYQRIVFSDGPFAFWVSDEAHTHWHAIDLRVFETTDLNEMFDITPLRAWTPWVSPATTSDDGTVLLVGTAIHDIVNRPAPPATPVPSNGPEAEIGRSALLIDGSLEDIRVVGPIAPTSSDMVISPDGRIAAWVAPSDTAGERILTMSEVGTGHTTYTQTLRPGGSVSLRFNGDGTHLLVVSGPSLDILVVPPDASTQVTQTASLPLPDAGYRIVTMTADGQQVLAERSATNEGNLIWVDVESGTTRAFTGRVDPGSLLTSDLDPTANQVGQLVVLDDMERQLDVLDLEAGEIVASFERTDHQGSLILMHDAGWLMIPGEGQVDVLNLEDGSVKTVRPPQADVGIPWITPSSDGTCAISVYFLRDSVTTVALIDPATGSVIDLPGVNWAMWSPG